VVYRLSTLLFCSPPCTLMRNGEPRSKKTSVCLYWTGTRSKLSSGFVSPWLLRLGEPFLPQRPTDPTLTLHSARAKRPEDCKTWVQKHLIFGVQGASKHNKVPKLALAYWYVVNGMNPRFGASTYPRCLRTVFNPHYGPISGRLL